MHIVNDSGYTQIYPTVQRDDGSTLVLQPGESYDAPDPEPPPEPEPAKAKKAKAKS